MLVTHHLCHAVYIDRSTGTRTRGAERPEVLVIIKMLEELLQFPIYSVCFLSLLMVFQLKNMGLHNLNFINKMFLIYFSTETIMSFVDGYLLLRLRERRFSKQYPKSSQNLSLSIKRSYDDRLKDCASFLTVWMFSFGSRTQFHGLLIFCRLD